MQAAPVPGRHGLSADDARALSDRILGFASADQTRVTLASGLSSFTRTATNKVTSAGAIFDTTVRITSVFGRRAATVTTNRLDDGALRRAVAECEALARLSPEDPEYLPELGPQQYLPVNGYYDATGNVTTETRARAAEAGIEAARTSDLVAAGFMDVAAGSEAVASSTGLFAYASSTGVASTLTVRTADGGSSGWAGDEAADWTAIESGRIAEDAVRKCREWRNKTDLAPGRYDVVLEPAAAGMLMLRMMNAFDARQAHEGRSYLSKPGGGTMLGERVFDAKVSICSDPAEPNAETNPFSGAGVPITRRVWVEEGVLRTLSYSRFWADKNGTEPVPPMSNFLMTGGNATLDDMIRSVRRGVLITRFWYIRPLNPRTLSQTGLTRDGTFLIENGRLSRPVTNFRFNQSLVELLQKVEMLGRPTRVCAGESSSVGAPVVVPAMKVRDFHLASVSDAI